MLTQSNEILIFVEHYGMVHVRDLTKWNKNSLRGALGKLEALRLLERTQDGSIKITDKGIKYIDEKLENLHVDTSEWTNEWQCVLFGVAESNRPLRDKLRRFLQSNNYANVFKTGWVKPVHSQDGATQDYINVLGLADNAIIINFKPDDKMSASLVKNWPLQELKKQYLLFLKNAQNAIKTHKRDKHGAYQIKKTIFELADILDQEPKLPKKYMPEDWPRDKAYSLYKQLKTKLNS